MRWGWICAKILALSAAGLLFLTTATLAADIKVMISGGMTAAYKVLVTEFETKTGHKVTTSFGPSMGATPQAIPSRLERGELADVVIMVGYALGELVKQGKVVADSRVDLVRSSIGMVVRAGAPKPDISTVDALKKTLLAAKSIAYSDSASGVYISTELFPRLGIANEMAGKARMIPAEPVGAVVARGDAELGFQQISELLHVPGVTLVAPLPADAQRVTIFSAGIATAAVERQAGLALIEFLASPAAVPALKESGLEPIAGGK